MHVPVVWSTKSDLSVKSMQAYEHGKYFGSHISIAEPVSFNKFKNKLTNKQKKPPKTKAPNRIIDADLLFGR